MNQVLLCFDLYFCNQMPETKQPYNHLIYLAPLQGFTDYIYRKAFFEIFQGIDVFFIPYISVKNNQVLLKYEKEISPENNTQNKVIPQVLVNDSGEMLFLSKIIENYGYTEINLNLGCPYPMVTNREKGAGLLPHPDKVHNLLSAFYKNSSLRLSVKLRAGLSHPGEIEKIIPVLNRFPLTEVILHPRIAKQLYEGDVIESVFENAAFCLNPLLVYNGDIFSAEVFHRLKHKFSATHHWMLGRGVLMNPFLPAEIKGISYSEAVKQTMLATFHNRVFELYSEKMDNDGNVLNKMKQFWIYFSFNFAEQKKSLKLVKKANNLQGYRSAVKSIFYESGLIG